MNQTLKYFILKQMGIDVWTVRPSNLSSETLSKPQSLEQDLEQLAKQAASCRKCPLHESRTQTVFGSGNPNAKLMLIGEAPGMNEDKQGKPFVGRAGQLLTQMLRAIHIPKDEVYIANVIKCRPPNNRDPDLDEVVACTSYLNQQIELIRPKLIIALGRIAAHYLLKSNASLSQLRRTLHYYGEKKIPLLVTYHPAYLLRSPSEKRKAYLDFLAIRDKLADFSDITKR